MIAVVVILLVVIVGSGLVLLAGSLAELGRRR